MTSRDFCYWLQGFFELHGAGPKRGEPHDDKALNGYQVEMIEKHLAMVFKHETLNPEDKNMSNLIKMNQIIQLIRDYNSDTSVSPETIPRMDDKGND